MGAWIEISFASTKSFTRICRTPRWVRGLKFAMVGDNPTQDEMSHPTMGAWIEITIILIMT